ncbi:PREDICTED: uncharacterized protein LOC106125588 [Papilio xuthus]|uniref:Uncharacterized protein LOC106125588 n=1 Tax=Papilio xuthus TaxID=66420 RepID=A0AAJ6ZSM3_PAPXU|nr:PREDICTED: uncharacterized protein LOC106125588 [Papilio xuthus]
MTSDQSVTSSSSQARHFGLYRTIDARTEEFLRLSRKRQIRQGCACAAVSTAITVTIIVAVLLIYEYAIVVESSLVQNRKSLNKSDREKSMKNLRPIADRLDRSYFGFDQDYYERMPLLVNALAENVYTQPFPETVTVQKYKKHDIALRAHLPFNTYKLIRRTSPRPFNFDQISTPYPFSKMYGSKTWVDSYRNAQRMKNLQHVMMYLGKTINAKHSDIHTIPTQTHIAFTGMYIEPANVKYTTDSFMQKVNPTQTRHRVDPLFTFKPDNPGDVNLLAEDFASGLTDNEEKKESYPYSRIEENCSHNSREQNMGTEKSNSNEDSKINRFRKQGLGTEYKTQSHSPTTSKMLEKIYITTSRPVIHFKPRSARPVSRTYIKFTRPRPHPKDVTTVDSIYKRKPELNSSTNMIVNVNVFPMESEAKNGDQHFKESENSIRFSTTQKPIKQIPIIVAKQVEDYHVGSSGIIPMTTMTQAREQEVLTVTPLLDTTEPYSESIWSTNPPDVIKFSREDAKIPDQYTTMTFEDIPSTTETNSRTYKSVAYDEDRNIEAKTLIIKLVNNLESTTRQSNSYDRSEVEEFTTNTYVPQINGHYRNMENLRKLFELLKENSEKYRRNRLKPITTVHSPTYVPTYIEIKRNRTGHFNEYN